MVRSASEASGGAAANARRASLGSRRSSGFFPVDESPTASLEMAPEAEEAATSSSSLPTAALIRTYREHRTEPIV